MQVWKVCEEQVHTYSQAVEITFSLRTHRIWNILKMLLRLFQKDI